MKKWLWLLVVPAMLCGCGAEETPVFETVGEQAYQAEAKPAAGEISLMIPEKAVAEAMSGDAGGEIYTWDDHTLQLQTMEGGNIQQTVETLTGMGYEDLTVMCYKKGELTYYQTVWSAAGEEGTLLGRALVADDGVYHYCVSLISPEESDSQAVYDRLCASFSVTNGDAKK